MWGESTENVATEDQEGLFPLLIAGQVGKDDGN